MRDAVLAKFQQNKDVREVLLSTDNYEIIEKTTEDYFWGCGTKGDGHNWLGKILMETRSKLR